MYLDYSFRYHRPDNSHLPQISEATVENVIHEFNSKKSIPDPVLYIREWFHGKSLKKIGRRDIRNWIGGILFNNRPELLRDQELDKVDELIGLLESILYHKFVDLQEPCRTMLLTLDRMDFFYRPLVFYGAIKVMDLFTKSYFSQKGFQRHFHKSVITHFRLGTDSQLPLVFFHGLGIGFIQYVAFINALVKRYPNRTIVLFEMSAIAMRLEKNHLLPHEYAHIYQQELSALGIDHVIVIGHSMGTACIAWIDKFYPGLIKARIFCDPVCFYLWSHHIVKNFVYRSPETFLQYALKYLVAMEPGITLYLRKYFVWHQNVYFSNELPLNSCIFLSEKDDIVSTRAVSKYLERHAHPKRTIHIYPLAQHGQAIFTGQFSEIFGQLEKW
jgi:hypothetical protein